MSADPYELYKRTIVPDCQAPPELTITPGPNADQWFHSAEVVPGSLKRTATGWEWQMRAKKEDSK